MELRRVTRFLTEYVTEHAHRLTPLKPANLCPSISKLSGLWFLLKPPWQREGQGASSQEAGLCIPALLPTQYVILVS